MNYRTWRTYLADTMEHLSLTQAEAITHIDGMLRAKRFPKKWKYHTVRISDEAINYTRTSLAKFDAVLRDTYAPALRDAMNQPSAFAVALNAEMSGIEADVKRDANRPLFDGVGHARNAPPVLSRRKRIRRFLTKQRHPVEVVVRKRGWIKPDEHECDDY